MAVRTSTRSQVFVVHPVNAESFGAGERASASVLEHFCRTIPEAFDAECWWRGASRLRLFSLFRDAFRVVDERHPLAEAAFAVTVEVENRASFRLEPCFAHERTDHLAGEVVAFSLISTFPAAIFSFWRTSAGF